MTDEDAETDFDLSCIELLQIDDSIPSIRAAGPICKSEREGEEGAGQPGAPDGTN